MSAHNFRDLTGMRFDYLTVLKFNKATQKWICQCDCGNRKEFKAGHLNIKSRIHSCGCMNNMRFIDITDKEFGKLTAKYYIKERGTWVCECSCGNIVEKKSGHLRGGFVKSCGCINKEKMEDLTEMQFGSLIAKQYLGNNIWSCRCKCGNYKNVISINLKRSNTITCDECNANKLIDLTEQRFNMLVAKEHLYRGVWLCECDCGNTTEVASYDLRNNRVVSCGCAKESSKENELFNCITKIYSGKVIKNIKDIINPYELDIYIPEFKLAIEFNGDYWHSTIYKDKYYHQNKTITCAKQGIHLIHIFEHEWDNLEYKEKILNYIYNIIDSNKEIKTFARKCNIKIIENNIAKQFLDRYHIQDGINSEINIGCYYQNELIGVMTFGKPRFNKNYDYEIHRLCWKPRVHVTGGTEKLFSYFINKFNPQSIITYVDISKFTGNVYSRLGFKPIQPNPITEPNYVWVNTRYTEVLQRYKTQKHKLVELGFGTEDQTEDEIMNNKGYLKIYNSGNLKLEYIK